MQAQRVKSVDIQLYIVAQVLGLRE